MLLSRAPPCSSIPGQCHLLYALPNRPTVTAYTDTTRLTAGVNNDVHGTKPAIGTCKTRCWHN
eukprot:6012994-Prymnesium_polylepis.1